MRHREAGAGASGAGVGGGAGVGAPAGWRAHRLFLFVLGGGALLRFAATAAYWPALTFYGDSYTYLRYAREMSPDTIRPFGYSALLALLSWSPTLAVVPVVQHLTGVAIGIAIYVLLLHRRMSRRLAACGAAPLLLDAYQVDLEQMVMAETLFAALLVAALALLTWRGRPSPPMCAGAGVLFAACALTRTVALGLVVVAAAYLTARSVGARRLAVFGLGVAVPLFGYASWFSAERGTFALQTVDGLFLWGRVAPIAQCAGLDLTPMQARMCSPHPPEQRPGPTYYDWHRSSPRVLLTRDRRDARDNALLRDLAQKIVLHQPGDYARLVLADTVQYFAPVRRTDPHDWYLGSWQFPVGTPDERLQLHHQLIDFNDRAVPRRYVPVLGGLLRGYQTVGATPGPVLAGCVGLGVLAAVAASGYGTPRARHECLLLVTTGVVLLVLPAATAVFDYRYMLPTLVCLPPAGALAVHQLRTACRQSRTARGEAAAPSARAPAAPSDGWKGFPDHASRDAHGRSVPRSCRQLPEPRRPAEPEWDGLVKVGAGWGARSAVWSGAFVYRAWAGWRAADASPTRVTTVGSNVSTGAATAQESRDEATENAPAPWATGYDGDLPYEPRWLPTLFDLDDLLDVLDVTPASGGGSSGGGQADGVSRAVVRCLESADGGIIGAQLLGQQVVLAERIAIGKRVHTVHTMFHQAGRSDRVVEVDVERLQEGRSCTALALTFRQAGQVISRANVLLGADEADFVRHEATTGTTGTTPTTGSTGGPDAAEPVRRALIPWESRRAATDRQGGLDLWFRVPDVGTDETLWRALLAFGGEVPALQGTIAHHGASSTEGLPAAVLAHTTLAHTTTFVDPLDVRDWHLLRTSSSSAASRSHVACRGEFYGPDGLLKATSETFGLLRAP